MSQKALTFQPPAYPGANFIPDLSDVLKALASNRKGAARPSDVQAGETWINDSGTPWLLNLWDGVQDILIASINPTQHTLTMGGLDKLLGGAARGSATISGGIIAPQVAAVAVDTEGGGATDDLDSIGQSALGAGRFLLLSCVNASRKVVIKNQKAGSANPIATLDGADYTLDDPKKSVLLLAVGSGWNEIARLGLAFGSAAYKNVGTGADDIPTNSQVSSLPAGAVVAVAAESVPAGFLECNGAEVSRTTYASLFAAVGVIHGQGNGSTTFNLPDLRGRFLRGWDHGAARDPDRAIRTAMSSGGQSGDHVGSVQGDEFKSHIHSNGMYYSGSAGGATGSSWPSSTSTGASGGNETRPINANVMYCIKY